MVKKILLGIAALMLLSLSFLYIYFYTDIVKSSKEFAVKDVASLTKITISRDTATIVLEKRKNSWYLNGEGEVKPLMMQRLLYMLANIEIKGAVPSKVEDVAHDALDHGYTITSEASGIVVSEIILAEFPERLAGTVGVVEGKRRCYFLGIPGNTFSPASVLTTNPLAWHQNILLSLLPSDIVSVNVDNIAKPQRSFKVFRGTDGEFHIYDTYSQREAESFDKEKLDFYLSFFGELGYDQVMNMPDFELKTLVLSEPEAIITVSSVDGKTEVFKLYLIPQGDDYDDYGRPLEYDRDLLYIVFAGDKKVVRAHWVDYDLLLRDVNFFLITN
jgi:hypothetical protein